ncbi:MAG: hypothetical protein LJF15_13660 [Acidobacteria bacterium]|nr:hypothetical protein [Acidobacteriota bacterium]
MPAPWLAPALVLALAGPPVSFSPESLWSAWPSVRFVTMSAPCLRHAELVEWIRELEARHPGRLSVEQVGRSVEGRAIHLLILGSGPRRVLLWSQMHGDEPSATPALLDIADFVLSSPDPQAAAILEGATLLLVPMLNPDGADRYARRNAQAIDLNRDALQLTTPEGRLLKELRDRFEPELGFNLHDQDRRTTVGSTGRLATIALLAVAGDEEGTMTPGRARAKRACAAIARALEPFIPGGISRYDEDWNPRAFGDNITSWGTPVVLVESGGLPPGWTYPELTRLNFVALLSVLSGLVGNDLAGQDPQVYKTLERNQDDSWVDVLVHDGEIWQPPSGAPYRADLAFDRLDRDPLLAACDAAGPPGASRVREIGDGRFLGAAHRIDAAGRLVAPAFTASMRGLEARQWLDEEGVATLARLGVARLRWRVEADEDAEARAAAGLLEGPGWPVIEVTEAAAEGCFLEVAGRPSAPSSMQLDHVLDALTLNGWRTRAAGRPLAELLGRLSACPPAETPTPALAPDRPASFLLLRPEPRAAIGQAREAEDLSLEAVFIDGREPAAARRRR